MKNIRTVTLELLRHGPPHNQLLSPLTRYLALCGKHPAETLEIPFEHGQLLARLRGLSYQGSAEEREFQLRDMAQIMGGVLSNAPGLIAELVEDRRAPDDLIHLRLIISASELAQLPFELSNAPNGFPGAGQRLMLQSQLPICVTREIRRADYDSFQWPATPKILFAAASPPGAGTVPGESHLLALRKVIEPWVECFDENRHDQIREEIKKHLIFLPNASLQSIERACASDHFTHVHILAHGIPHEIAGDREFGIALHDSFDDTRLEIVDGDRLATALRSFHKSPGEGIALPTVVTLACCDSGNVGSVISGGASVAHSLHQAGIPLVVASQFPLTFGGSVKMVQVLYEQLLWGGDPRRVLADLRRQLHTKSGENHDWASLVAYAALPVKFNSQLKQVQISQSKRSIKAANNAADRFLDAAREQSPESTDNVPKNILERMEPAVSRLLRLAEDTPMPDRDSGRNPQGTITRTELYGLLGSTDKIRAQLICPSRKAATDDSQQKEYRQYLKSSMNWYKKSMLADISNHWAIVQYLSLACVLGQPSNAADYWTLGRLVALHDATSDDSNTAFWAHGSLAELYLLAVAMKDVELPIFVDDAEEQACFHARELATRAARGSFHIDSTQRQFIRYRDWYNMPTQQQTDRAKGLAEKIIEILG